jgi:glycosyltransferase involved in cell wall biosynthesis
MLTEGNFFTVSRRIPHHASHSGYDALARYIGTPVVTSKWLYRIRGLGALHRYFRNKSGMEWYDGLYAEILTSFHMRRHEGAVYHFIYCERDFRYLPRLRPNRRHKVIGTFHATPDEFEKVMKYTEHLQSMDAAIVVSRNQISMLERIIGNEKVFFIPVGVDTDYFVPPTQRDYSSTTCICVGHHHRDFDALAGVASIIRDFDPRVRIVIVNRVFSRYFSPEQQHSYKKVFASAGNVELRSDLTDEELIHFYQTSALMILPLLDTTANLALLEALSCGLPVVVTDTGGIRDYVDSDSAAFAPPKDVQAMADHVIRLLQMPEERQKLSLASRTKALTFDWHSIAKKLKQVYLQTVDAK